MVRICSMEKQCYDRMVAGNLDFRSEFTEEQIGLLPETEYDKDTPTKLLQMVEKEEDEAKKPHAKMRARLLFERHRRKVLQNQLEAARKEQKDTAVRSASFEHAAMLDSTQAEKSRTVQAEKLHCAPPFLGMHTC